MANEIRLRANNIQGTTTDNPLTSVATTINSLGFIDLPVVTASNHLILILDPLETAGPAEIVMVTAHASLGTVCTIVRAQESSVARTHQLGTTWFHGPTVADWNFTDRLALSSNRPASPFNGQLIYETDTDRWTARSSGGAWLPSPHNPPTCRVFNDAAISVPDNGTAFLACNQERFDTDNMHSTSVSNHLITINTPGVYMIGAGAQLAAANDYQRVLMGLVVTGVGDVAYSSTRAATLAGYNEAPLLSVNAIWKFTAGQSFAAYVFQDNGGGAARNIAVGPPQSPEVWACWIGVG